MPWRNAIHRFWIRAQPYVIAMLAVAMASAVAWLLQGYVSLPNLVLLFMLAVVAVAFVTDGRAAMLASVLASLAYAGLYLPIGYLDAAELSQYVITAVITMAMSLFISQLTTRWRDKALESAERARELDRLYRYTRELETERLRNSVLSALSHDLRTPLAGLIGASSSLMSDEVTLTTEARQELASLIYDESRRMQALVENLLELARLESGPVTLQQDWQALDEIIGAVLPPWRKQLAPRTLILSLPDDLPLLRFDPRLIERVLVNLLENIGKYTPAETQVMISAQAFEDRVELAIADNGPGFCENPDQLFQKFYRGDSAGPIPGAGLGLAICRAILEAHHGHIRAELAVPHGAIFTLSLPRPAQAFPLLRDEDAS